MRCRWIGVGLAALAGLLGDIQSGSAHPHVFVDARTEIVFDAGRVVAVRQAWRFDEGFSSWAAQGLDKDNDGKLSREELAPLAQINVDSLKEFDYFTFFRVAGKRGGFKLPEGYFLQVDGSQLTLYYSLPIKEPAEVRGKEVTIDIFDPTYFVDFKLVDDDPVKLIGAPADCKLTVTRPKPLDASVAAIIGQVPATERELPPDLQDYVKSLANRATVVCP